MNAALSRLTDACRQHLNGQTFANAAEMKAAIAELVPSMGPTAVQRMLADVDEVDRAGQFGSFQKNDVLGADGGKIVGANPSQARLLGNVGPGPLALIATTKKGAVEVGPMAQVIRQLAGFRFPEHAAESLSILARTASHSIFGSSEVPPFELGATLSTLAAQGRLLVGTPAESTGLGRLISWDLDGNLVFSQDALRAAKSNAPLMQLALLRAVLGLKMTEAKIDKLASERKVESSEHHYEIRYTTTGHGARTNAAPIADHLCRILAPGLGLSASDVEAPQLPVIAGAAYYPGGSQDNRALLGTRAMFPNVDRFLYVDPSYGEAQTGRPDSAPEATVMLVPGDATRFDVEGQLGGKVGVGIFACPGDWAFLMQVPEFVANTIHAIEEGGVLLSSSAWQYRPPMYLLPVDLLGLHRTGAVTAANDTYECFVKSESKSKEAMTLAVDVDRCLSMLSGFMGGTFSPVRGEEAGDGTLLKRASELSLRFRPEAWPDFIKEIDARIRARGDSPLQNAFLDVLAKLVELPADDDPRRRAVRGWIQSRIARREPAEEPIAILKEPIDTTPRRTLDFPSVRYEEFGMGILAEGFKPDAELMDRLIGRMQGGEASLTAETFAQVLERSDAATAQKRSWTERATPFFATERTQTPLSFTLEVSR